jgi:hypothetical protein
MSDPATEAPPRFVERCPDCGYPFTGLPVEGNCPECGEAYDANTIILFGRGRGFHANLHAGNTRAILFWLPFCIPAINLLNAEVRQRLLFTLLVGPLLVLAQLVKVLLARREGLPAVQVWLDRTGGSMRYHVPWRLAALPRPLLAMVIGALVTAASLADAIRNHGSSRGAVALGAGLAGLILLLDWLFRDSMPRVFRDRRGALIVYAVRWENARQISITSDSPDRYRVRVSKLRGGPRPWAIDAEVECDGPRAKMVDEYVEAWLALTGRPVHMAGLSRE